ncbi:MAG: ECF-type sigma factor [Myxococcota bacterium]
MSEPSESKVGQWLRVLRGELADPEPERELHEILRREAYFALGRERPGHSLQTTSLAHEAYMRLVGSETLELVDRAHLRRLIAKVTRQVLVDHARRKRAEKRGGDPLRVSLHDRHAEDAAVDIDTLALNQALEQLEQLDPRAAKVVELRAFGDATAEEVAAVLSVSRATVQSEWRFALTWLRKQLASEAGGGGA